MDNNNQNNNTMEILKKEKQRLTTSRGHQTGPATRGEAPSALPRLPGHPPNIF